MMKRICLFLLLTWGMWACSSQLSPEEAAMEVAQKSYDCLLDGDYEAFLNSRADMEGAPASFREQLLVAYKQFVRLQQESHQGIALFTASRAQMDSTLQLMQVFMLVSYADSTQEEIVVPMVERNGEWKLR